MGVFIIVGIVVFGAWTAGVWKYATDSAEARYSQKLEQADKKVEAQAATIVHEAETKITDMQAAYDVGEQKGKTLGAQIQSRSKTYVTNNAAFRNTACDIGNDLVQLINYSGANMRAPTAAGFSDATLPAAGPPAGRQDANGGGSTTPRPQPSGTVGGVHPKPRPIGGAGKVPG